VELIFVPNDERKFKSLLIINKTAYVTLHKTDGVIDPPKEWNVSRFGEQSNPTWTAGRDFAIENGRNAGG
jgi:hypothetical protein